MPATATVLDPQPLHPDREAWDAEVVAYEDHLNGRRRSPNTVTAYKTTLLEWARFMTDRGRPLDPTLATRRDAIAFRADQVKRLKPTTASTRIVGMITFFRWLEAEWAIGGVIRPSPFHGITSPTLPRVSIPRLSEAEVDALLGACEGTKFLDLRDRAMFALMLSSGLRVGEVAALLVDDVVQAQHRVWVASGKGEKERVVGYGDVASEALRHYLRRRAGHRDANREESVGIRSDHQRIGRPLFLVNVQNGHRGGISTFGIGRALHRRAEAAGIGHVHPHQLRHTFAQVELSMGVSEGDLMQMGGWTTRTMMDRYTRGDAQERALAAYKDPLARADRKRR